MQKFKIWQKNKALSMLLAILRVKKCQTSEPQYDPSKIIDIMVRKERIGKDFVQVKASEEGVTVTVRIYNPIFDTFYNVKAG